MRRHAKASSAGSTSGQGSRLGSIRRGDDARRASSPGADGSGAPSVGPTSRSRFALLSFAALLFTGLALAAAAFGSKEVVNYFGTASGSGSLGGQFNNPRDIAVNRTGAGPADQGDIYIADDSNHRVERFDKNGNFVSAWGADVVQSGGTGDVGDASAKDFEVCTVSSQCKAGVGTGDNGTVGGNESQTVHFDSFVTNDTFTLGNLPGPTCSPTTTAAITWDSSPANLQANMKAALEAICGAGTFSISSGPNNPVVTFQGALGGANQPTMICAKVSGSGSCNISSSTDGVAAVSATSAGNGSLNAPQSVAIDNDTGNVYVSDRNNRRIDEYDGAGNFLRAFGFDVVASGPDDTGTGYEVCDVATNPTDICKSGVAGSGTGQYGSGTSAGTFGIAVSQPDSNASTGKVFLADSGNRRVDTFDLDGTNPGSFGAAGSTAQTFGSNQPTKIAVDSAGVVYASNSNLSGEIERYDTAGSAFLDPITPTNGTPAGPLLAGSAAGATSGLAVSSAGTLYVLRDPSSGNTVVQQFNSPGATTPPAADDDEHGSGAGFSTVQGLGLDDSNGKLYVSATNSVGGLASAHRVYVLDNPLPAPVPAIDPITVKTDTTATFTGTVDPVGGYVNGCKFQYSTDQVAWTDVNEPGCAGLVPGSGAQAVSESVTGLLPNTPYFVRLQVSRTFIPNSAVTTLAARFSTDSVPPVVSNTGAVQVTDTSARLVGTIDPKNSVTGYVFQYGPTPALGSSTPAVNVGGGTTPLVVSQAISGLDKDTTYYFRLVATNAFGTTNGTQATLHTRATPLPEANPGNCSNEALRQAQASTGLPDCRAYEQVSPVDKNGGDAFEPPQIEGHINNVTTIPGDFYTSADGADAAFSIIGSTGDPSSQNYGNGSAYLTHRTASGWAPAYAIQPHSCTQGSPAATFAPRAIEVAPDFHHAVINQPEGGLGCQIPPLSPNAPTGEQGDNLYRTDLGNPAGYDLLNLQLNAGNGNGGGFTFQQPNASYRGASDDQSRIVVGSTGPQIPGAPIPPSPPAGTPYEQLYEWQQLGTTGCPDGSSPTYSAALNACFSLISRDPAGNPFTSASEVPGSEPVQSSVSSGAGNEGAINSVSADGNRVFFQEPDNGACSNIACHVYLRDVDAETTYDVSQSECTVSCGSEAGDLFQLANPAGTAALFTSTQKLTDSDTSSSGADLYIYHDSAHPATDPNLTDLSIDNEPADGTAAAVQGVVGASENLDTVFFVANGQLVAGGPIAAGPKLYRWQWNAGSPTIQYLATLDSADALRNWIINPAAAGNNDQAAARERRVSPDGGTVVLDTAAQLDPVADQDSDADVYRWTAASGFQCISCQAPGAPSGGPSTTGRVGIPVILGGQLNVSNETSTAFSDDGQRIFFQTQDALVPADTNGPCVFDSTLLLYHCTDVYEWHDGRVSLITPGDSSGATDVKLVGATPSGSDVFITTRQPLVGWDQDTNIDIYDAHVGGGFPEPDAQGTICEGEACRGAGTAPTAGDGPGTPSFEGAGNPKPLHCAKGKVKRHGRCVAVRHKKRHKAKKKHHKRAHHRAANHNRRASR